jgi:hypothetical protein
LKALHNPTNIHAPVWYKNWRQKNREKEERERALEPPSIRMLTFVLTLASMMLGLSLLPIFPQPLPVILAFLVAFVTFKSPKFGMPVGTALIGFGLMYHLAAARFISSLGEPIVRGAVVFIILFLFAFLPFRFHRYKAAIAVNMGIIAAILLFFSQTYFLAIPLILTSVVLFKRNSVLTVLYYVLISVPLEIMQYFQYISQTTRVDWWVEAGSSPPIYVPMTQILNDLQVSMTQFRLYDTSQVVYEITGQVTWIPPPMQHTVGEALSHYLDSLPGIALFLVIVVGLVFAISFLARALLTSPGMQAERIIPTLTATVATILFFLCLSGLQAPLAFRAEISGTQVVLGTLATVIFTMPTLLIDPTPKRNATIEMITKKAQDLLTKLQVFEEQLNTVKSNIPLSISSIEARMLITKDRLNEILRKTSTRFYDSSEINEIFTELNRDISNEIDNLMSELNISLGEYQISVNCEYSTWMAKLNDLGLGVEATAKTDYQKELTFEARIDQIKQVLDATKSLADKTIQEAEQVYSIIKSLYDPSLPEESRTITFARQKLDEETNPWMALDALYVSLNNWRKQYGAEISASVRRLQDSLGFIINLSAQSDRLLPIFDANLPKILEYAKRAEGIKISIEKRALNVLNVTVINDIFQSSLNIADGLLSILYEKLQNLEGSIDSLLPSEDYLWGKNVTLMEQIAPLIEIISNSSKYEMKLVMENLPKSLSYIDDCVATLSMYNEKYELLLNYPIVETAIEDLFKQKKRVTAHDLPFEPKYAEEYLKLFHGKRYRDFSFDDSNMFLMRKT